MEVTRKEPRPLTPAEQAAMDQFRQRIHQLALHGGLTSDSLRNVVKAMKAHPEFSHEILHVLFEEMEQMDWIPPGTLLIPLE